MSDVLTITDLETAKKHDTFHSEVITGKAGGFASGANIDYATNVATGQTQKTLRKTLEDIGPQRVNFTFTTGGTFTSPAEAAQNVADGNWYSWGGTDFPHVVAPGTNPAATGSGYVPRTDVVLRAEITPSVFEAMRRSYAEAGYTLVTGSFEEGGTLTSATDVLLHKASGKAYSGQAGAVAAGTSPTVGSFVDKSGVLLRALVTPISRSYPVDVTDYLPVGYVTDGTVSYAHIIKQVLDEFAGKNPVLMPNFPVLVDPASSLLSFPGILVPSYSTIIFQQHSKLLTKANSLDAYEILSVREAVDVTIHQPRIIGDKYTHTGTTGEFGMGIAVRGACKNVTIIDPITDECWGDGIYVGQTSSSVLSTPENTVIIRPVARKNRRQGLSVTSANGLVIENPQWWGTKSSDCATPLPNGPHAGIDIEPNGETSMLRGIKLTGVRGGGNDGGLFYTFLGQIATTGGNRYHVEIDVDSVTDENSRHAVVNMGLNKNSLYSGAINIGRVISNSPFWNGIRHRNHPVQCGLPVNIDYASINNWQSTVGLAAKYRTPVVIEYEGTETGYPTIGNFHIGKLDLFSSITAANLSDNAVILGLSTGTLATPATQNVTINMGSIKATKSLRIEGEISADIGLNNRFGSQLKYVYAGSANYLTNLFGDTSIEPAGASPTITLPSTYPANIEGNSVRFMYVQGGAATLARLRSLTVPMYLNGVVATNITFTGTAGVVTLTFRLGAYYVTSEGVSVKES